MNGFRLVGGSDAIIESDHGRFLIVISPGVTISLASLRAEFFIATVVNTTARRIWVAGVESCPVPLYPGQRGTVLKVGDHVSIERPALWAPDQIELFVSPTFGSDANDGLSRESPMRTGTAAFNFLVKYAHSRVANPIVTVIDNEFEAAGWVHTATLGGTHAVFLRSNPGTLAKWKVPAGGVGLQVRDGGIVLWAGFHFEGGEAANFVRVGHGGIGDCGTNRFGAAPGGYHLMAEEGGHIGYMAGAQVLIAGGAAAHLFAHDGGNINLVNGETYFIEQPVAFGQAFAVATHRGAGLKMSSTVFHNRQFVSGRQFYCGPGCAVDPGAIADPTSPVGFSANSFPGDQPGVTA